MQPSLFAPVRIEPIPGLHYEEDFLGEQEEAELLAIIGTLPLHAAQYKQYLARRKVLGFGGSYDFDTHRLGPGSPLDERLLPLRNRVADWMGVEREHLQHVLVAEYAPGTPLGWHCDVPDFEAIAGVSLGSEAVLKFRPYPPDEAAKRQVLPVPVAPRSIYRIEGLARWGWQHCVPPVKAQRWSITFRTPRAPVPAA